MLYFFSFLGAVKMPKFVSFKSFRTNTGLYKHNLLQFWEQNMKQNKNMFFNINYILGFSLTI